MFLFARQDSILRVKLTKTSLLGVGLEDIGLREITRETVEV
jgi:hypothetical protein